MGFGVSGASAIIFLGLLIAGVTAYSATDAAGERIREANQDNHERLLDRRNTAINVTNATLVSGNLTVAVENTGSTTLSVNDTTVLVNNTYYSTSGANVDGVVATDLWEPGETLRMNVSSSAPARVTVATESGVTRSTDAVVG